jgi:hypothetical protein
MNTLYDPLPPNKQLFCVAEIVPRLARVLYVNENAARIKIYRAISNGEVKARQYLGSIRIPRDEAIKILEGEPI